MPEAYIVEAVRTPVGRRRGQLSNVHPVDLAAFVIEQVVSRSGIDPTAIDDVIFGCVDQVGAQAMNIARNAILAAGLPDSVPGVTVDRQCGSSQQAIHFAAQAIKAGDADLVLAGGVEVMSMVPLLSAVHIGESNGLGNPWQSPRWRARFGDDEVSQFHGAELVARRWNITRLACDEFALRSHALADQAWREGRFDREVVPIGGLSRDEGIRADSTMDKLAALATLREGGVVTAASSSQISDAAACLALASADGVRRYGLRPRARVRTACVVGSDPIMMLAGPIAATERALARAGLTVADIDLFEVNEAFAPVVLAWLKETGAAPERVNVNGGAISLGHPLGASGARLATTLLHELERTGGRLGLQTMCEGAGTANATIFERVDEVLA